MTRASLACALLLLAAAPAAAQAERTIFRVSLGVYGTAAVKDARDTRRCVEAVTCTEANPALKPFVHRYGIRTAMGGKLAVQGGIAVALIKLREKYPWPSTAALAALSGMQVLVDVHNARTLQRAGVR